MSDRRGNRRTASRSQRTVSPVKNGTSVMKGSKRRDFLLKHTYSDSPIAIGICDREGRFVDGNAAWLRMFDIPSVDEMEWPSLFGIPGLTDLARMKLRRLEAVTHEVLFDQKRSRRSQGSASTYLSLSIAPLSSNGSRLPRGYVIHAEDRTDRHSVENDLAARVDELKLSEAVLDGRLTQISKQHEVIRGMLLELEDSRAELASANATLKAELSESDRLERILRESEKRLRLILDSILAGVVITDVETNRVVDINLAATQMIGLRKSQIIGRLCDRVLCIGREICCSLTGEGRSIDQFRSVLLTHDGLQIPIMRMVTRMTWQDHDYLVDSFVEIDGGRREPRR